MLDFGLRDIGYCRIICHPYRTARVGGCRLQFPRQDPLMERLEERLVILAGCEHPDNHTVYEIAPREIPRKPELMSMRHLYVAFTDDNVFIGSELIEGGW